MFCVLGKSLAREMTKKDDEASTVCRERRYLSNEGAYQISPDYSCESLAWDFVALALKGAHGIRCLHVASLQEVRDELGTVVNDGKGKPKMRYKAIHDVTVPSDKIECDACHDQTEQEYSHECGFCNNVVCDSCSDVKLIDDDQGHAPWCGQCE